jgi:transcriptional regulator GlxA family with amidase domain
MRILTCLLLSLAGTRAAATEPLRVGVVVFEGVLASEVVAPVDVFSKAASEGLHPFEVLIVGPSRTPVRSHEGLLIQPQATFAKSPALDILVVPSSMDTNSLLADRALVAFAKERGARARYVASHCAGAFVLGKAGLLDGKRATTYIGGAEALQKKFPRARIEGDEHVVVDGNLVTSIGGAVSYEGSLALLERIAGAQAADRVAQALYYFRWNEKRPTAARTAR